MTLHSAVFEKLKSMSPVDEEHPGLPPPPPPQFYVTSITLEILVQPLMSTIST